MPGEAASPLMPSIYPPLPGATTAALFSQLAALMNDNSGSAMTRSIRARAHHLAAKAQQEAEKQTRDFFTSPENTSHTHAEEIRELYQSACLMQEKNRALSNQFQAIESAIYLFYGHLAAKTKSIADELNKQTVSFERLQEIIKTHPFLVYYLAQHDEKINQLLHRPEMRVFWEQRLIVDLQSDQHPDFTFSPQENLDYVALARSIDCYDLAYRLSSITSLGDHLILKKLIPQCEELAYQPEFFCLLHSNHQKIRENLREHFSEELAASKLNQAIALAKRDARLPDTSSIFPHTLRAQHIHGPAGLLNEAMNKIAIASGLLSRAYQLIESYGNKQEALESEPVDIYRNYIHLFIQRALHDVFMAERLAQSSFYKEAVYNALSGKPIFTVFNYANMPPISSWPEFINFFIKILPVLFSKLTLTDTEISMLRREAEIDAAAFFPNEEALLFQIQTGLGQLRLNPFGLSS